MQVHAAYNAFGYSRCSNEQLYLLNKFKRCTAARTIEESECMLLTSHMKTGELVTDTSCRFYLFYRVHGNVLQSATGNQKS